ncbi:MAG: hypothetical protein A3I11_03760 [Elusimicrobia bacterium RIFCSPLOWO2_02_FULL_39_32]|nr:MAG: hypothetical protein A2034_04675 [Elusimicrobia bacterium GWA2_38_7]OGR79497.1 MAG: hypothetical protein A3B80_02330 [Elusimicrobia bacterium RIFCSPHIGHO2_02_FULL_39_36]OGR92824.1 MAG: hypothetical protein A3I11_03760 [Elusimicrobia bacterium RIFCSPLOWO2_02_FULL_39_32]OGR99608.1 MAG: hypothetical protein A3G85_01115 [Elusimicrobia bacterium RIFCSPLOWO2_12_FULL_39_28]
MIKSTESKAQHGFTLIELMIVVAIIGILAAVAIPKFADMLRKSKEGATKGSLTNLRSALTIYISDNEGLVPQTYSASGDYTSGSLVTIMTPKYMEVIPTVKLGTYHNDSGAIRMVGPSNRASGQNDAGGWVYSSADGGAWFVNCSHTDTKNAYMTSW